MDDKGAISFAPAIKNLPRGMTKLNLSNCGLGQNPELFSTADNAQDLEVLPQLLRYSKPMFTPRAL